MKSNFKHKMEEKAIEPVVAPTIQPVIEPIADLAEVAPVVPQTLISLRVFEKICGKKPDQMGGFMYHAKVNKWDNLPFSEWQEKVLEFNNRLIK